MYNLTAIAGNSTGLLGFIQGVNSSLMDGWFGSCILMGLFLVFLLSFIFKTNDVWRSMAAASFITFGMCIFLRALGMVPNLALFICLVAAAAGVAFIKVSGD